MTKTIKLIAVVIMDAAVIDHKKRNKGIYLNKRANFLNLNLNH